MKGKKDKSKQVAQVDNSKKNQEQVENNRLSHLQARTKDEEDYQEVQNDRNKTNEGSNAKRQEMFHQSQGRKQVGKITKQDLQFSRITQKKQQYDNLQNQNEDDNDDHNDGNNDNNDDDEQQLQIQSMHRNGHTFDENTKTEKQKYPYFLETLFKYFSKMNNYKGGMKNTFDQISSHFKDMNMNNYILFCKTMNVQEIIKDYVEDNMPEIKNNQIQKVTAVRDKNVDIFKKTAINQTHMKEPQFVQALNKIAQFFPQHHKFQKIDQLMIYMKVCNTTQFNQKMKQIQNEFREKNNYHYVTSPKMASKGKYKYEQYACNGKPKQEVREQIQQRRKNRASKKIQNLQRHKSNKKNKIDELYNKKMSKSKNNKQNSTTIDNSKSINFMPMMKNLPKDISDTNRFLHRSRRVQRNHYNPSQILTDEENNRASLTYKQIMKMQKEKSKFDHLGRNTDNLREIVKKNENNKVKPIDIVEKAKQQLEEFGFQESRILMPVNTTQRQNTMSLERPAYQKKTIGENSVLFYPESKELKQLRQENMLMKKKIIQEQLTKERQKLGKQQRQKEKQKQRRMKRLMEEELKKQEEVLEQNKIMRKNGKITKNISQLCKSVIIANNSDRQHSIGKINKNMIQKLRQIGKINKNFDQIQMMRSQSLSKSKTIETQGLRQIGKINKNLQFIENLIGRINKVKKVSQTKKRQDSIGKIQKNSQKLSQSQIGKINKNHLSQSLFFNKKNQTKRQQQRQNDWGQFTVKEENKNTVNYKKSLGFSTDSKQKCIMKEIQNLTEDFKEKKKENMKKTMKINRKVQQLIDSEENQDNLIQRMIKFQNHLQSAFGNEDDQILKKHFQNEAQFYQSEKQSEVGN